MALSPRDKRALIILGGVAGVAVVAFLLFTVLSGGGGEEAAEPAPPAPATAPPSPAATDSPTPTPSPATVVNFSGRDPFVVPAALLTGTPTTGVTGTTSPTSTGTTTTTPTDGATTTTSPTDPPTAPSGGQSQPLGGHDVVLLNTFMRGGEQRATIEVDGRVFTVAEGERFDGNFRLISVTGECARVGFGDEAVNLCTNPQK
jgi:hypothetical protein